MTASITIVTLCVALVVLALRLRDLSARLADVERRADDLTEGHVRHGQALQDLRNETTGHGDSIVALTRSVNRALDLAAQAYATAHSHEAAVARWERERSAKPKRRRS